MIQNVTTRCHHICRQSCFVCTDSAFRIHSMQSTLDLKPRRLLPCAYSWCTCWDCNVCDFAWWDHCVQVLNEGQGSISIEIAPSIDVLHFKYMAEVVMLEMAQSVIWIVSIIQISWKFCISKSHGLNRNTWYRRNVLRPVRYVWVGIVGAWYEFVRNRCSI